MQLIVIVATIALPAAGIIIASGIQQKDRAVNDARMDCQRLVDRIESEQRIMVASTRQLVVSLSQLPEVKSQDITKANTFLGHILKLHPNFSNIFIADRTGVIWASAVPFSQHININDRRFFKNALASGILSSGEFQVGRVIKIPTLNLGYPYKNGTGSFTGVISAGIALEDYRNLLQRTKMSDRADIALVDYKGLTLLSSNAPHERIGKPIDPVIFKKMQDGPDSASTIDYSVDGGNQRQYRYVSYQKLRIEGEPLPYMYVRVGIPVESVLLQAKKEIVRSLSIFTIVLAAALTLAWFISKYSISDRISLLEQASKRLADGDHNVRVADLMVGGELGKLGETFDSMAKQLASREESLAESQRFLHTIIDTEPDCVKMLDSDGRILMMNPAGLEIIGADSLEQIKGKSIFECIALGYRDAFVTLTNDVFQGRSGRLEFEADNLKGKHLWLGTHVVPFRNDLGKIISLLGITRDITERKRADQALRESESALKKAQQLAKLGSWSYALSGVISWSDELYRIYGVSPETFIPTVESFINLIHPDDRSTMLSWIEACASGKKPQELEFRIIWSDGTVRYISGRGELIHNDTDSQMRMTGTAQDITERKKSEEALAKSESAFRATFEQAAVGMARVAPDGRWLEVNQRLCDIVGYKRDELITTTYQDIMHPDDLDSDIGYVWQVLVGEIDTYSKEMRIFRKDQTIIWVNFTVGAVRDSLGAPTYSISVVEDITQRKRAEEELAEKQRLLEELNISLSKRVAETVAELRQKDQMLISQGRQAAMGEMIGNIAHQWRQPLNTLALIVQEIRITYPHNDCFKDSLKVNVDKAMCMIQHMSKTIDDFGNYFKPDKERLLFNVNKAVTKVLTLVESSLANLNINIEVIEQGETFINGYENEYSQVLLNIFLNCRDAFECNDANQCREIKVTVIGEKNKSVVTVADNAGGIPEDIMNKIFDPYFTTKGPDKGTGIGLYMAKTIIEKNMGGILSVRNTSDGAEFKIEI